MPRDLPPTINHLYRNVLPESTQNWLNSYVPQSSSSSGESSSKPRVLPSSSASTSSINQSIVPLASPTSLLNYACRKELIGKPRIPLTKQQLENEFTLFLNEPSSSGGTDTVMDLGEKTSLSSSSSSSSLTAVSTGTTSNKLVLKFGGNKGEGTENIATSNTSLTSSSSFSSINYTAIFQIEDDVIQLLSSNELNKAIQQEVMERFQVEILQHSLTQLRNLRWDNWTDGNPFIAKLTKSYVTKAGIGNYFDHIKVPMDLTTMQEKLSYRKYKNPELFFTDVNLIIYNAKLFNGPHYPEPIFPDPSSGNLDSKKHGPTSVYGMAFEFERKVQDMKPRIEACYTQLQRVVPRKIIAGMDLGGGNDLLRRYYSKEFQESLIKATKLWAETHGINLVK